MNTSALSTTHHNLIVIETKGKHITGLNKQLSTPLLVEFILDFNVISVIPVIGVQIEWFALLFVGPAIGALALRELVITVTLVSNQLTSVEETRFGNRKDSGSPVVAVDCVHNACTLNTISEHWIHLCRTLRPSLNLNLMCFMAHNRI